MNVNNHFPKSIYFPSKNVPQSVFKGITIDWLSVRVDLQFMATNSEKESFFYEEWKRLEKTMQPSYFNLENVRMSKVFPVVLLPL